MQPPGDGAGAAGQFRHQSLWEQRFRELKAFRREHGHCNVPDDCAEDRALGDGVGQHWKSMYAALAAFKEINAHCRVSTLSKPHKRLANWVRTQRAKKRQGRLTAEESRHLDELGFTWDVDAERWEAMFAALVAYRDAHGDCEVPFHWPPNVRLGHWVGTQRLRLRRRTLTGQQIQRLTAIGFR